jgi:hypothetical protein
MSKMNHQEEICSLNCEICHGSGKYWTGEDYEDCPNIQLYSGGWNIFSIDEDEDEHFNDDYEDDLDD